MSMGAAAVTAAAARKQAQEEEEEMTSYTPKDLSENWEFKILRSGTNKFRDPAVLREILNEEARAGWTLVEKFDDTRLRLKRPASAYLADDELDFDPYRTWIGITPGRLAIMIIVGALVLSGLIIVLVFGLVMLLQGWLGVRH